MRIIITEQWKHKGRCYGPGNGDGELDDVFLTALACCSRNLTTEYMTPLARPRAMLPALFHVTTTVKNSAENSELGMVLRALTMAYVVGDVVVISQNTLSPTHARSTPLNATKSQNDELSNGSDG